MPAGIAGQNRRPLFRQTFFLELSDIFGNPVLCNCVQIFFGTQVYNCMPVNPFFGKGKSE
jgi:hypothetical protein